MVQLDVRYIAPVVKLAYRERVACAYITAVEQNGRMKVLTLNVEKSLEVSRENNGHNVRHIN